MSNQIDNQKKWAQLVAKAWADEGLKQRLLKDPAPLLREYGIEIPAGASVSVVQDRDTIACLIQPQTPAGGAELTPSQLGSVAGGAKKSPADKPVKYLEVTMQEVFITGVSS